LDTLDAAYIREKSLAGQQQHYYTSYNKETSQDVLENSTGKSEAYGAFWIVASYSFFMQEIFVRNMNDQNRNRKERD